MIQPSHFQSKEPALEVILQQVWLGALLTTLGQILMSVALSGVPWLRTPEGLVRSADSVSSSEKSIGPEDCQHGCFRFKPVDVILCACYILCLYTHVYIYTYTFF